MRRFSRLATPLLVIAAMLVAPTAVAPASAVEATDPMVVVLPPQSVVAGATTPVVDGPFDLVVEVTGGVSQELTLTPQLPS